MRRILTLLIVATVFGGCKKKCGTYHVDPPGCVSWASRFAGDWYVHGDSLCSNDGILPSPIIISEGSAPNLLYLHNDHNQIMTVVSETVAEGGPYTLGDQNGTLRWKAVYHPAQNGSQGVQNNLGQNVSTTPSAPEYIEWYQWMNENTADHVGCSVSVYRYQ